MTPRQLKDISIKNQLTLEKLYESFKLAAEQGETAYMTPCFTVSEEVIMRLVRNGFKTEIIKTEHGFKSYLISWDLI